jgi:hypothetical protein
MLCVKNYREEVKKIQEEEEEKFTRESERKQSELFEEAKRRLLNENYGQAYY